MQSQKWGWVMEIKIEILKNINLIIVTNMVESKAKATTARARIAHKLARYYRATPVHLAGVTGQSNPSTSHLSTPSSTQPSAAPPSADSETKTIPGTPPTTRDPSSRERASSLAPPLVAHRCSLAQWSFCSPVPTGDAEWSS
jgi:hypothetical protein